MQDLKKYLELKESDRSYQEGLALLGKYGKNRTLINNLSRNENPRNREALFYNLNKIVGGGTYVDPATVVKRTEPLPAGNESIAPLPIKEDLKADEAELKIRLSKLHGQRAKLSNSLGSFKPDDNEGRKKVLAEMQKVSAEMEDVKFSLQQIKQGIVPSTKEEEEQPADLSLPTEDLKRLKRNKESYRTKAQKKLAMASDKKEREELEILIKGYDTDIAKIKEELKKRTNAKKESK